MSLTRKVAYNFSVQIAGKAINTIIGILNVAIITRYLGVAGYGDYTTTFAYIAFFSVISDFGFFWIIIKRITAGEGDEFVIKNSLSIRLIFAALVFLIALILLPFLPYTSILKWAIVLAAFSIFWSSQTSVYTALFQAKLKMDFAVISEVIARVISMGLIILAVKLNQGLLWVVGASLAGTLINFVISFIFSFRFVKPSFGINKSFAKQFLLEALPIGVVSILGLIYFKVDTVILSLYKSNIDVGIYGTPYKILEILMATPLMFVGSVFPALSTAFASSDHAKMKTLFQKSFDLLSIGAFGVTAVVIALAKPITNLIAGKEFLNASTVVLWNRPISADIVLQVLIFAVGISFFNSLLTNSVVIFGKQNRLLKPYFIATVFNLAANILLIPIYSYLAAAVTTVVTELIILIYCWLIVRKEAPVKIEYEKFFLTMLVGLITFGMLFVFKNFSLFFTIPLALAVYGFGLLASGVINKETFIKLAQK